METVAVHRLRETTHTRCTACVRLYLLPSLGRKKLAELAAEDVRARLDQLRTTCQCCALGLDTNRDRPQCCAAGKCCHKLLSPLTLAYVHSVLKSALEHAVREEEIPRNVARNVRIGTPRPRRFEPLTTDEARQLLTAAQCHRLHALFELALHTGLRKGGLLGLRWEDLDLVGGTASIRRTLQRHQLQRPDCPPDQDQELRTAHRPAHTVPALPHTAPRPTTPGMRSGGDGLE